MRRGHNDPSDLVDHPQLSTHAVESLDESKRRVLELGLRVTAKRQDEAEER